MTISAQVIDTIVEWIDDNLHQPLRIDDIARHAGYSKWHLQRLFLQYKGESLGRYIRERKAAAGRPRSARHRSAGLRYLPEVWLRFATDLYPRLHPDLQSAAGRLPQREPQSRPLRRASLVYRSRENQRRHTQRSTRYSMAPSAKNHRQNSTV